MTLLGQRTISGTSPGPVTRCMGFFGSLLAGYPWSRLAGRFDRASCLRWGGVARVLKCRTVGRSVGKNYSVMWRLSQQALLTSSSEPCQFPARSLFSIHPSVLCFQTASTVVNFCSSTNQASNRNVLVGVISRARCVCFRTADRPNDFHPPQPSSHREPESSIAKETSVSQLLTIISLPAVTQSELSPATSTEVDNCKSDARFPPLSVMLFKFPAISFS